MKKKLRKIAKKIFPKKVFKLMNNPDFRKTTGIIFSQN